VSTVQTLFIVLPVQLNPVPAVITVEGVAVNDEFVVTLLLFETSVSKSEIFEAAKEVHNKPVVSPLAANYACPSVPTANLASTVV